MKRLEADMTWMQHGACLRFPRLGWIKEPRHVGLGEESTMAVICHRCPVLAACEAFVDEAGVTAGFWAGHHRTAWGPTLPLTEGDAA